MLYPGTLIIYGGGLTPCATIFCLLYAKIYSMLNPKSSVFIGRNSFLSLINQQYLFLYSESLFNKWKSKSGGFIGTCRNIDLSKDDVFFNASIANLKNNNITTIIVCGGDGSSRQCNEIYKKFEKNGIHIIFGGALTVDGINGGRSFGYAQAVRESLELTEKFVATSLNTYDGMKPGIAISILQGRNRDDILAGTIREIYRKGNIADFSLSEIELISVPANHPIDEEKIYERVRNAEKPVLILISEGAKIGLLTSQEAKQDFDSYTKKIFGRKTRQLITGHLAQSNYQTTEEDIEEMEKYIYDACHIINSNPNESFDIVYDGISCWKEPAGYFANKNPKNNQVAELSKGLEMFIKQ